jgi:hypothetical protein
VGFSLVAQVKLPCPFDGFVRLHGGNGTFEGEFEIVLAVLAAQRVECLFERRNALI